MYIIVKCTHLIWFGWFFPQCSIFYRVIGHILVEILCALCRPHFCKDFFSSNLLQMCIIVKSSNLHTQSFSWYCRQCSVFYRVKGHILVEILCALCRPQSSADFCSVFYTKVKTSPTCILVHILVCAAFHDGFFPPSNFVWGCILLKSTRIVFGDAAPSVPSFVGLKVIFWLVSGMRSAGHISWFSFLQILYGGTSWSNIHSYCFWWCCPQSCFSYRIKCHILVVVLCAPATFLE